MLPLCVQVDSDGEMLPPCAQVGSGVHSKVNGTIVFIEVLLIDNASGAQQSDQVIHIYLYYFSDYFPL